MGRQRPEPSKIGTGLAEHVAQAAAAIVAALEHPLGKVQEQTHLSRRCTRIRRNKWAGDGLAQPRELADQRPHLVPCNEPARALNGAQPLLQLRRQPAAAVCAGQDEAKRACQRRIALRLCHQQLGQLPGTQLFQGVDAQRP